MPEPNQRAGSAYVWIAGVGAGSIDHWLNLLDLVSDRWPIDITFLHIAIDISPRFA